MPRPTETNATYLPGLDGLRAISVLMVLGYHLGVPSMGGGLVGVGMFFTLSGYLITTILLRELVDADGVDLKRFWLRRLRRLLPALIVVLVVVLGLTIAIEPAEFGPGSARAREHCSMSAIGRRFWLASPTSNGSRAPGHSITSGRWRSRSSSMCSGHCCWLGSGR